MFVLWKHHCSQYIQDIHLVKCAPESSRLSAPFTQALYEQISQWLFDVDGPRFARRNQELATRVSPGWKKWIVLEVKLQPPDYLLP